jgi:hypothetical protein
LVGVIFSPVGFVLVLVVAAVVLLGAVLSVPFRIVEVDATPYRRLLDIMATKTVDPGHHRLMKDLEVAEAFYETHPRSTTDIRQCDGSGTVVPKARMREAYSTTPDELPGIRHVSGARKRRPKSN